MGCLLFERVLLILERWVLESQLMDAEGQVRSRRYLRVLFQILCRCTNPSHKLYLPENSLFDAPKCELCRMFVSNSRNSDQRVRTPARSKFDLHLMSYIVFYM